MNVGSAGRLSAGDQPSLSISGLTWERAHRSLSVTQILFMTPAICPRERDTAGPSATVQNLFSSGQFRVMKNPGDALNAGKLSVLPQWNIRKFKLPRNPINARNVVKLAAACPILNIM